jgi:hypothetical protein
MAPPSALPKTRKWRALSPEGQTIRGQANSTVLRGPAGALDKAPLAPNRRLAPFS